MLSIQTERIHHGQLQVTSANESFPIDCLERFVLMVSRLAFWRDHSFKVEELYLYYRTLNKIISKVIAKLESLNDSNLHQIFDDKNAPEKLLTLYRELHANTRQKMQSLLNKNADLLDGLNKDATIKSLHAQQQNSLNKLYKNEIVSNKLYIILRHELSQEQKQQQL